MAKLSTLASRARDDAGELWGAVGENVAHGTNGSGAHPLWVLEHHARGHPAIGALGEVTARCLLIAPCLFDRIAGRLGFADANSGVSRKRMTLFGWTTEGLVVTESATATLTCHVDVAEEPRAAVVEQYVRFDFLKATGIAFSPVLGECGATKRERRAAVGLLEAYRTSLSIGALGCGFVG